MRRQGAVEGGPLTRAPALPPKDLPDMLTSLKRRWHLLLATLIVFAQAFLVLVDLFLPTGPLDEFAYMGLSIACIMLLFRHNRLVRTGKVW
jgi:hypothetical protein